MTGLDGSAAPCASSDPTWPAMTEAGPPGRPRETLPMRILDTFAPFALALTCVALPAFVAYRAGIARGRSDALAHAERVRRSLRGDR